MSSTNQPFFGFKPSYSEETLGAVDTAKVNRANTVPSSYVDAGINGSRFKLPKTRDYQQQYFNVYRARLESIRKSFQEQVQTIINQEEVLNGQRSHEQEFGVPIWNNLPDAKPGQECIVIGVTYKTMEKKPSVLDDIGFQHQRADNSIWKLSQESAVPPTTTTTIPTNTNKKAGLSLHNGRNYCHETDVIHLEDINGRVPLVFTDKSRVYSHFDKSVLSEENTTKSSPLPTPFNSPIFSYLTRPITTLDLVSGMVMAAQGELSEATGEFIVSRCFLQGLHFEPIPSPSGQSTLTIPPSLSPSPSLMVDRDDDNVDDNEEQMNLATMSTIPIPHPEDSYTALLSGLNLASLQGLPNDFNRGLRIYLGLLIEFLTGKLSSNEEEKNLLFKNISSCIIAGDLIGSTPIDTPLPVTQKGKKPIVTYTAEKQLPQPPVIQQADAFLAQLCAAMHVYLMPGSHDPTNYTLPQQPFNRFLFPSASLYSSFHPLTNPAQFAFDMSSEGNNNNNMDDNNDAVFVGAKVIKKNCGDLLNFLGTDGAAITSMTKHSSLSPISALALATQSQHLAPVAPDTIGLYPYQDIDPLAFHPEKNSSTHSSSSSSSSSSQQQHRQPDIVFAGNSPHFQTVRVKCSTTAVITQQQAGLISEGNSDVNTTKKKVKKNDTINTPQCDVIDLISIPNFSTTGSFVLMNNRTRQCIPIYLNSDASTVESLEVLLNKMNFNVNDDVHASIEFGEDDEAGDGGE